MAGVMVVWLAGCNQSQDYANHDHNHDHDHEGEHSHSHDGDGDTEHHHGTTDHDGEGHSADLAAQKAAYPLKTCVVGGEVLGSMGDPVEYVHEGRLVQFCCEGCIDDFKKDTAQYLAKLDAALPLEGAEASSQE